MNPPFKKKTLAVAIEGIFALVHATPVPVAALQQKIRKQGPFKLPTISPDHHYFCHVLGGVLEIIPELPDFSDDNKIAVMSDYGGEHSDAHYSTYSFLFVALNKNGPFQTHMQELRRKHKILDRYSEFKYKDLKYGPRSRALSEYLKLIDNFIHGAIVTVAIDKTIGSVFGSTKSEGHATIAKQLEDGDFGSWPGHVGEKVMRVLHILAAFTAALTYDQQRLLWYSDTDQINEDAKDRSFAHVKKLFGSIGAMYMTHCFDVLGFAKSFSEKGYLDDLLSVPDLAAGMLQDLLAARDSGADIPGGDEKLAVLKWLATPAKFLSKIHVRIARTDDGTYEGQVLTLEPKW
ncbi:hypothetical protein HH213_26100 [Duganella dendranthematis]|uniref:DUF3800 domain-containing protein n=2 Tax=Duganella dendranthematis TaxID=2728021 RepID=A0ABX6MJ13_9BURK|nr:hypothetical protein HH213_26100 [Duganella dendranthematis]